MMWITGVVILLYNVLLSTSGLQSVLDLPKCGLSYISNDKYMSTANPLIARTSRARSSLECLANCWRSFPLNCNGVFKDKKGNCYELNGDTSGIDLAATSDAENGEFAEIMSKGTHSSCNGRSCASDEVCFKGCGNEDLEYPVCTADQATQCGLEREYTNIRHYWSDRISDGADTGTVMFMTYPKTRGDSGLRVIIHMAIRGHYQAAGYCHHWYLTFDNNKCDDPHHIETLDYSATTGDEHRAMDLDGTCYGLAAGNREVRLEIDACDNYGSTDGHTGWNSARTMLIMEMVPQTNITDDALKPCPHLNVFNYQYASWNEELDQNFDVNAESRLIKAVDYDKMASDTSLRIKYQAIMSLIISDSAHYYCARWFVKIDDVECSPQLDDVIHQSSPDHYTYWRDSRRVHTIEGICDNTLSVGTHKVEIWLGRCISSYTQPTRTITGGFNAPSRLHIEEVRRDHPVDGVISNSQVMYRSHSGNLERHHWWRMNNGGDVADIFSVTYVKEYADTGLRLTASGNHRIIYNHPSGHGDCGRWYFKIDGNECSNPGRIEGVSHFNYYTNIHKPMQVSGVCHGVSIGSHTIVYAVGNCYGRSTYAESYTGWESSFHLFIEELRVDHVRICTTNPLDCDTNS